MEKTHGVHKVLLQFKKSLFVLFNATVECLNSSLILKNFVKTFLQLDLCEKNFVKHIENLPQHLSKKFIRDIIDRLPISL